MMLRAITQLLVLLMAATAVRSRLVLPRAFLLRASRQISADHLLQQQIDGYFHDGGFPRAGRSLQQKIQEAEDFLAHQIPRSGIVGVGAAIVYEDQVVLAKGYGLRSSNVSSSQVDAESVFQIGSVSKTMVAVAIGLLVEEGKVKWTDPVKTHIPWLQLYDKYAEQHLTLGDLLAMNSGFGALPDLADFFGKFTTEREYVEALKDCKPQHSLRETPEYANVNFVILGQVIEEVSGQPWYTFLRERVWEPLGMHNTYGSAADVPQALRPKILNDGHFACDGQVIGPFNIVDDPQMQLSPGRVGQYDAAGSIVSSSTDMAIFLRLMLNKGSVGNVTLLKSPSTIGEMVTGHVLASAEIAMLFDRMGLHYDADGGMIAAGYGIDIVGQAIWGHAYYDKSGDVAAHQTRTGFAPLNKLAVIFMGNSQVPEAHASYFLDHYRSYVMGIFLDVPKAILDHEFAKWRAGDQLEPPVPGAPRCGLRFWEDPPRLALKQEEADALVGTYVAAGSEKFYPSIVVTRKGGANDLFTFTIGRVAGDLLYIADIDDAKVFVGQQGSLPVALPATRTGPNSTFIFNVGVDFQKVE